MLDKISHKGKSGIQIIENERSTIGVLWPPPQTSFIYYIAVKVHPINITFKEHFAEASNYNLMGRTKGE